jgi:hypothetical protein
MASLRWLDRIRALDVRLLAAIAATLLLIGGVMWVVPTTPDSNSFTFDTERRSPSDARLIEPGSSVRGTLVDGSDTDFYRFGPFQAAKQVKLHLMNGSAELIPGLRVFDAARTLIADQTIDYVRKPGSDIDCSFSARPNITYYVQVLGQRNTTGPYTLTITVGQ